MQGNSITHNKQINAIPNLEHKNMKEILIEIDSGKYTLSELVTILEVVTNKMDINTISGMARTEGKSPNGIKTSNQYQKLNIGDQKMCVKGLNDSKLPF
jgi:hypothetical protein